MVGNIFEIITFFILTNEAWAFQGEGSEKSVVELTLSERSESKGFFGFIDIKFRDSAYPNIRITESGILVD